MVGESGTVVKPERDEHGQSETLTWIITQIPAQKPARGHAINNSTAIQIMAKIAFLAMMKEEVSKCFRPLFYDTSFRGHHHPDLLYVGGTGAFEFTKVYVRNHVRILPTRYNIIGTTGFPP